MSAHALLALALLGRAQDEASHVLVSPPFEDNPDFWHPSQGGRINTREEILAARAGRVDPPPPKLDPAKAKLILIRTPVPFIAETTTSREALGKMRFSDLLRQADLARRFRLHPSIDFDDATRTIRICGCPRPLLGKSYVQLRLLARAMKEQWRGADRQGVGGAGWLTLEFDDRRSCADPRTV